MISKIEKMSCNRNHWDSLSESGNILSKEGRPKLRTMLVSPLPPPSGGIASWTVKYIEYCKKKRMPIYVVNTALIGKRVTTNQYRMVEEIRRSMHIWAEIRKGIRCFKPSIVHFNTNCSPRGVIRDAISAMIIHKKKVPFIVHCRCNIRDQIGNNLIARFFLGTLLKKASVVLVCNSDSERYVNEAVDVRVEFLPNFVNEAYIIEKKEISEKINRIVYVGHVRESKGIEEIIEIASRFKEIVFYLMGQVMEGYEEKIAKGAPKNIVLLGDRSGKEVAELLDSCDLLLFPSHTEGFSNTVLESMARGLPIVATRVGANERMIGNKGGILTDIKDINAMVVAIKKMDSPSVRRAMSSFNLEKTRNEYTTDIVMRKLFGIYTSAVG
ncbi:MAG: glycosyltransferase family 4 protein [Lachnospiraceae bacterium]|nr:glycosyltransferase family 4 protein [Lachnospiraceae bacterium]